MTRLAFVLLFLLATCCHAQTITVGDAIPDKDVETAKRTIEAAQPKVLKLAVGEFELIEPAKTTTQALLWLPADNPILQRIEIPAGQSHSIFGIRRGEKKATNHVYQSRPTSWCIVIGVATGQNTVTLIKSGDKPELAPVVVDTISVTVGNPAPVPPVPVDPIDPIPGTDLLVQAAQADIKAGKGTADDVGAYASLYLLYGTQVKNGTAFVTLGDLNKEMNAKIDALLGEDIEKCLPNLRKAVGKELVAKIPGITNASGKMSDFKAQVSTELLDINKRLGGVK